MEAGGGLRVLRGRQLSEEHENGENASMEKEVGREKRGGKETKKGSGSYQEEENDSYNPETDLEDAIEVAEVAAPVKRRTGRSQAKATTPSRRIFTEGQGKRAAQPRGAAMDILALVQEISKQLQEMRKENKELKAELLTAQTGFSNQLAEAKANFEAKLAELQNKAPSWAQLASIGNGRTSPDANWLGTSSGRPSTMPTFTTRSSQLNGVTYPNHEKRVVVKVGALRTMHIGKTPEELKQLIQEEMRKEMKTKEVEVIGISPPVNGRMEVATASKTQADAARKHTKWAKEISEWAKVKGAEWYPVKVDSVHREVICKKEGNGWEFKDDVKEIINSENSRPDFRVQVEKIHWLSPASDKKQGSLVMYLDSWPVVQQMLAEGSVRFGATIGNPVPYIRREIPVRCYHCNQYGHRQAACPRASAKCGKCSKLHQTYNCKGLDPDQCAACQGPHKVTDPLCPAFLREVEKLRLARTGRVEAPITL